MDGHLYHHDTNVNRLRARISASAYKVDPVTVADAIVRRWSLAVVASEPHSRPADAPHRRARRRDGCIPRPDLPRRADALLA